MVASSPGELTGPYNGTAYGKDAYGHPVNGYGRCQQLNETNVCPTQAQQTTYMMGQSNDWLTGYASSLGITIPLVHTNAILVPLIIAVLYPTSP